MPTIISGTQTKMRFNITLAVDDVDSSTFNSASEIALCLTLQDAIPVIPLDDISVVSLTEHSLIETRTSFSMSSYDVKYSVNVILEDIGYSVGNEKALYEECIAGVDSSVASGEFSENLSDNSDEVGEVALDAATVSSSQTVQYSDFTISTVSVPHEGSTHNVTLGTKFAYAIFILSMAGTAIYIVWSFVRGRKYFLHKYPPRTKSVVRNMGRSDDSYAVTVKRTTFSRTSGNADIGVRSHTTNPMYAGDAGNDDL